MGVRIGFDHYTIEPRGWSARQTLEFARDHQFNGVQFLEPAQIDPELDAGKLAEFRRWADTMGLYVEVGLPSPNPARRARELGRAVNSAERAAELVPHVEALAHLGCRHTRVYVGDRHDRFRTDTRWNEQIAATIEVVRRLSGRLRELGIRLAIETHADLTCDELCALLETLGPEIAGVMLDTGNLVMRLDDPVAAARRLAPHVLGTHVKDAVLAFTTRGLCWQARQWARESSPCPISWPR